MTTTKHGFERFGHPLALLPFVVVVEGVMLFYGGYLILRAPDVVSPKGILFLVLWGVSNFALCDLIPRLWRTCSRFIVSSSHLIVVDQIRRMRCEIPKNHRQVFFGTHLGRYSAFLADLRRRATNCQTFDPYPTGIGE